MPSCSKCGRPLPDGSVCPHCDAADEELVAVLRTSDSNLMPVVKSVLDAAGIPYLVQGDEAMGLLPLGPFGGGVFRRVLGASVLVPRDRAEEARELLESFESSDDDT